MFQHLLAHAGLLRNSRGPSGDSDELGSEELKLPKMAPLTIVIAYNILMQVHITPS